MLFRDDIRATRKVALGLAFFVLFVLGWSIARLDCAVLQLAARMAAR